MLFAALCVLFIFTECTSIKIISARTLFGTGLDRCMKLKHPETGREVVMIGMIHVEKPKFFEEIRLYLDSLKNEGYVVFYEGITEGVHPPRLDTILRKFRRTTGYDIDYFYRKAFSSKTYTMQTLTNLGLMTDSDINVDMTLDGMVTEYEKRYEEIVLTDYDWQTGLMEKYRWRKSGKQRYNEWHMIHTLREEHIVETVKNSEHDKIVLLYGAGHWFFLYPKIEDLGYRIIEGKPFKGWKPNYD